MKQFSEWVKKTSLMNRISIATQLLQKITIYKEATIAQESSVEAWSDINFIHWLKQHGVETQVGQVPKKFSDGGVGRAYFVGNKVVKFTNNRVEGNVANMVAGNNNTPTRIIGVYRFKPKPLWAILQKKIKMNLPKMIAKASDVLMAYVDESGISEFPKDAKSRMEIAKNAVEIFEESDELIPFILEIIETLDNLYRNTGFFHDDAVPQNLGMDDDKVVIPDLGPNQPKDFNARKSLDNIHQRRSNLGLAPYDEI